MYSAVNLSTNDLTQASALIEAPPCATPNALCPDTHLKTLALQDAPHAAKKQLGELLEALESLPPEQAEQSGKLAKQFIERYQSQPDVMACVFKYLNCRLMLNHAKLDSPSTSPAALASQDTWQPHLGPRLDHTKPIIGPVLTSHPTQLNQPRGTLLALNSAAAQPHTEAEAMALAENLWELAGPRNERPTVLDEASALTPVLSNVLQSIRKNTKALMQEINQHSELKSPAQLQAGNWVGGDRDGNPTITPELLREVMGLWSEVAFEQYLHKVSRSDAEARPGSLYTLFKIAGHEQELDGLANKIKNTRDHVLGKRELLPNEEKFNSPADLAAHVSKLKTQLNWEGLHPALQQRVAQKLDQLTMWANTFGFHGASTHIRQNSEVNQQTVHALLQAVDPQLDYASLDEQSKVQVLNKVLNNAPGFELPSSVKSANPETQKEINFLESYKDLRTRFGADALPNIITANTETLSDMLEVCVLLKYAGLAQGSDLGMNVVPLIETVPDMKNAPALLDQWLQTPAYKNHLETKGNLQHVMLGYSDSMRGHGIVSAAWEGHKLAPTLANIAKAQGVNIHFFHGRGGTEARGARENYAAEIGHIDPVALQAGYTQTEQGEEAYQKFGNRARADHNIRDMVATTLAKRHLESDPNTSRFATQMDEIAGHAEQAYQDLYQDPALADHLQQTTPLPHVGLSNAGSRPASRIAGLQGPAFLGKLRAIPYVASWYQSASMAPAYFGLGSGLNQYLNEVPELRTQRLGQLQQMYNTWPFFQNLVERADSAIQKADMRIAQQYADLNPSSQQVFDKVQKEYKLSQSMIALLKGNSTSTSEKVADPIRTFAHSSQLELLKASKTATPQQRPAIEQGIAMTMQTIANALGRFG